MSYTAYRTAILAIASSEAGGEDVETDIRRLAMSCGMESTSVRQDVSEAAEMLG